MNSRNLRAVETAALRPSGVTWIAALIGFIGCPACIDINGGAAELSWSLRAYDGDSVGSCDDARLKQVELCWQPLGDASTPAGTSCPVGRRKTFSCDEASGSTGFVLDPGPTAFWVAPLCRDGMPADTDTYEVPPPIVRTVEDGKIVTLNSLLIVVGDADGSCAPAGCTCAGR